MAYINGQEILFGVKVTMADTIEEDLTYELNAQTDAINALGEYVDSLPDKESESLYIAPLIIDNTMSNKEIINQNTEVIMLLLDKLKNKAINGDEGNLLYTKNNERFLTVDGQKFILREA